MIILALMVGHNGFAHLLVIWPIGYLVLMATVVNCIALNAMLMGLSYFRLPTTENHWNIVMFLTAIWSVCRRRILCSSCAIMAHNLHPKISAAGK